MIRRIILLVVFLFPLLLSGCAMQGYKDVDKRFFVVSMGIDPGGEKFRYRVHVKLAIPMDKPGAGKEAFQILTGESDTIGEAIRAIKGEADKELDFGHMKLVVVGKKLLNEPLDDVFDWFLRRRDVQKVAWVTVGDPDALRILEIVPKSERLPSNALFLAFGRESIESSQIIETKLFALHRQFHERGLSPLLSVTKEQQAGQLFSINTSVIIGDDGRAVWLGSEETSFLNVLLNDTERASWMVEEENYRFMINADEIHTSFKLGQGQAGRLRIRLTGTISAVVEEFHGKFEYEKVSAYERSANQMVNKSLLTLTERLRDEGVDPVGFGLRYRAQSFRNATEWEEWLALYPDIEIVSDVRVQLKGYGLIK